MHSTRLIHTVAPHALQALLQVKGENVSVAAASNEHAVSHKLPAENCIGRLPLRYLFLLAKVEHFHELICSTCHDLACLRVLDAVDSATMQFFLEGWLHLTHVNTE